MMFRSSTSKKVRVLFFAVALAFVANIAISFAANKSTAPGAPPPPWPTTKSTAPGAPPPPWPTN